MFKIGVLLALLGIMLASVGGGRIMAQSEVDLTHTSWRLMSYGDPSAPTPVLEGTRITLEFRAGGRAGATITVARMSSWLTMRFVLR